jgi:hypothetical protein
MNVAVVSVIAIPSPMQIQLEHVFKGSFTSAKFLLVKPPATATRHRLLYLSYPPWVEKHKLGSFLLL